MPAGPRRADTVDMADMVDTASDAPERPDESGVMTRMWPALLAGHLAWTAHLLLSYYLAWATCGEGDGWLAALRHLATLAAAAVTLAGWWRAHRAAGPRGVTPSGRRERRETAAQRQFLAGLAGLLSAMFLFAILMTGAANLFLVPCV